MPIYLHLWHHDPVSSPACFSMELHYQSEGEKIPSRADDVYELVSEQCSAEDYKHVGPVDDRLRNSMRQILTKGWSACFFLVSFLQE